MQAGGPVGSCRRGQPDAGPEAVAGQEAAQTGGTLSQHTEAARGGVPGLGIGRRAAQLARSQAAGAGLLVAGAIGDGQERGHGQDQQVPGHAHGVRTARAAPLPAAPLETPEALFDPVAAGVEGGLGVPGRGIGQQDPGLLAVLVVQHDQRAGQGLPTEGLAGTRSPPVGRKVMQAA